MSTLIDWPTALPYPATGRKISFQNRGFITEMESGLTRSRRVHDDGFELVNVSWTFTDDQYDTFKTFFDVDLQNGSVSFQMNLGPDLNEDYEVAFWEGNYQFSSGDGQVMVSAVFELIEKIADIDYSSCAVLFPSLLGGGDTFDCYAPGVIEFTDPLAGSGFTGPWITTGGVSIVNTSVGGIADNRMVLSTGAAARICLPANWITCRIGLRLSVDDTGGNITQATMGPRGFIGLLANPAAGLTNGPSTVNTSNFVGIACGYEGYHGDTWTRQSSPGPLYFSNVMTHTSKTGPAKYGTGGLLMGFSADPSACRDVVVVDIFRGAPNYTVYFTSRLHGTAKIDVTKDQLLASMMDPIGVKDYLNALPGMDSSYEETGGISLVPVDESNGVPNALCFSWEHDYALWRISEATFIYTTA